MPALHAHQARLLEDQRLHQEQPHCQRPMAPRQALGREARAVRVMLRKNLKLGLVFSAEGCNISSCVLRAPQIAGWSSLVARRAHNPEAVGSNPAPATKFSATHSGGFLIYLLSLHASGARLLLQLCKQLTCLKQRRHVMRAWDHRQHRSPRTFFRVSFFVPGAL